MTDQNQDVRKLQAEIVERLRDLTLPQLVQLEQFIEEEIAGGTPEVITEVPTWTAMAVAEVQL